MSSYVLLLYGNTLKTLALQKTNLLKKSLPKYLVYKEWN